MNKNDFIHLLAESLDNIQVDRALLSELLKLLKQSGQEKQFLTILSKRLKFLQSQGTQATQHEEFERLEDNIYSMHIACKQLNIRILYSFLNDGTVLLHAFYERAGKRHTDYTGTIALARARLNKWKD
ncbi:hypothetical protein [Butyricicoccus pullicaecorum]|uniref:hypothetical protein n=1 Tax=Butyricicoccus pullicaecorum TaxID=501571 RepID=UPI0035216F5D